MLVFAMGVWRPIGWRVSALAACYFAVSQRHHEAVIWYAALPELLVFFFCILSFLAGVMQLFARRKLIIAEEFLSMWKTMSNLLSLITTPWAVQAHARCRGLTIVGYGALRIYM
jgi:hypothetical protein